MGLYTLRVRGLEVASMAAIFDVQHFRHWLYATVMNHLKVIKFWSSLSSFVEHPLRQLPQTLHFLKALFALTLNLNWHEMLP